MSILREHTNERHRAAEDTDFVQYMLHGNITVEHYARYLQEFHGIYEAIERCAQASGLFEGLPDIERTHRMAQDIEELGYPLLTADQYLPSVKAWRDRVQYLYDNDQRDQIFAHVYVRHMGDMYGGKAIAKRVPGTGKCYEFADRPALIRAFDARLNMGLLDEALRAFDLAIVVFAELKEQLKI